MKTRIVIFLVFSLLLSCSKIQTADFKEKELSSNNFHREVYLNGQLYSGKIVVKDEDNFVTVINDQKFPGKIFHFDNEVDLEKWLSKQDFGLKILNTFKVVKKLRDEAFKTGEVDYFEKYGDFSPAFKKLIDSLNKKNGFVENNYETAARLGIARLYDKPNFRGYLGSYGITANVGRRARNKVESLEQFYLGLSGYYFSRTWWRGRAFIVFSYGSPYYAIPDLGGFRNDIESIFFN